MGDLVWSHGPRYFGTVRKEKYIYACFFIIIIIIIIYEKVEFIQTEIGIQ